MATSVNESLVQNNTQPSPAMNVADGYWVLHATINGFRQAVIHFGNRSKCDLAQSLLQKNRANCQWHGPFTSLMEARDTSDSLTEVALRSECRCLPRNESYVPRRVSKLSIPGLHPRSVLGQSAPRTAELNKVVSATKQDIAKPKPQKAGFKNLTYAIAATAVAVIVFAVLLSFPLMTVDTGGPPFMLRNIVPIPVTDLEADCRLEMASHAATLRTSHELLRTQLGSGERLQVPCMQAGGKSIPETSGLLMNVSLDYNVLGLRHVKQSFQFVASRTPEGFCRWFMKE
jgi:hypothetical protein